MANRAHRLVQMSLKEPENRRKSRRQLNYEDVSDNSIRDNVNDSNDVTQDISDEDELIPLQNVASTSASCIVRPLYQKVQQLQQHDVIPINDKSESLLTQSGLSSLIGSPGSIRSVDLTASPSAIFKNISNIELFFQSLDKEIENKNSSPEQTTNKLYVKALVSDASNQNVFKNQPAVATEHITCENGSNYSEDNNSASRQRDKVALQSNNLLLIENGNNNTLKLDNNNTNPDLTGQGIHVSYANVIEPRNQVIIDMPTDQEDQPTVIIVEDQAINNKEPTGQEKIIDIDTANDNAQSIIMETEISVSDDFQDQSEQGETESFNNESNSGHFRNTLAEENIVLPEKPSSPVKLTRKRQVNQKGWSDVKNKRLKNSGQAYMSVRSHKSREARSIGATCSCKRNCSEKIDANTRKAIFHQYWALGDHEKQWDWILRHITATAIKKMQLERKNNRTQTIYYKFPTGTDMSGEEIVCKRMFIQTLGITEKTVYTAIEKKNSRMVDLRGKHNNRPRKISEDTEKSITDHIKEFPAVESHYTRKRSSKVYLSEDLNLSKMYRLYKSWFASKSEYTAIKMGSKHQYEMIFNTKFNISFFRPKKDQCETCTIYNNADEARKLQLKEQYDNHIEEKDAVRDMKNLEKCATDSEDKTVSCFDLEKVLHIPQCEVSTCYYKRKFSVFNFTVYDLRNKKGFCYVWHQQIAKRGANEIGSCLWHYINCEKDKGNNVISLYSDACAGQNRNRFIFALYQYACKKFNICITHRFFVSGHSQSEGDAMHSCVERAKKHQSIYTPEQMYFVIENSKIEGEKFDIKVMTQNDFYDIKKLVIVKGRNWIQDNDNEKVYWSKIREVAVNAGEENNIYFKYRLSDAQKCISTDKTTTGSRRKRNSKTMSTEVDELQVAYTEPIPIPVLLYRDLMSLCNSGVIPERHQAFYRSLIVEDRQQRQVVDSDSDIDEDE